MCRKNRANDNPKYTGNEQTKTSKQMKTTIRHILSTLALAAISATAQAQIGYQVSLLNTATGEPRANVTVNAQVTITDSQDNTIYSGSQRATTNDFGVLSLAVGDANTFANADTGTPTPTRARCRSSSP